MARQLEAAGVPVNLLALLDARMGSESIPDADEGTVLYTAAQELAARSHKLMPVNYDDLKRIDPKNRRAYLVENLKDLTMVPAEAAFDLADRIIRWFRVREKMWREYHPGPLSGTVVMFRSTTKAETEHDNVETPDDGLGPLRGWDRIAQSPVELEWVPGTHNTLLEEPNVRVLAAKLRCWLEKAAHNIKTAGPHSVAAAMSATNDFVL
jgi:thioesterase domain-containing protein